MNKALTEEQHIRLKKLYFRSLHRGCKEADLLLAAFAENRLPVLTSEELDSYEAFLDEQDADIWDWLIEKSSPPRPEYMPILSYLRQFRA